MRIKFSQKTGQALVCVLVLFGSCSSCSKGADELPLVPPETNPLEREFIGYGVVNSSFVHISGEPSLDSVSLGYLRKGSLVRIIERRSVTNRRNVELWLLVETEYQGTPEEKISGWLREQDADIFDNEGRARTAAEAMLP
jgi:hypothetical protein